MLEIKGDDIYISRREAGTLNVTVYCDGEVFYLGEHERLRLKVFSLPDYSPVLEKFSEFGHTAFNIRGEDTEELRGTMGFSVALLFEDGSEATIIGPGPTYIPRFYVLED